MRRLIGSLLAAMLFAAPAISQTAPEACVDVEPRFDALIAALQTEGWDPVPPGEAIPEAAAERVALARMAFYATTDRGGATLPEIMALQRRTVTGYSRRVDTELARLRVLTRGDDAMTLNWSKPQGGTLGLVEVICRIATTEGTPATGTDEGFGATAFERIEAPLRRVTTVPLEPSLQADLTTAATTTTIIETVSVLAEE